MAKLRLNPAIKAIRGKMGDIVFRVSPSGKQTLMKRPDMSGVKWSEAQKENRKRMRQAIAYAQAVMADTKARRFYEKRAAKESRQPFRVAVSDYMKGKNLLEKK